MICNRANLETCGAIRGAAVVIDVLRAFTTAAVAFRAGAREIVLTDTVESAFTLKSRFPGAVLLGEVDGYPIEGFDFTNSPAALTREPLEDRVVIQRTSSGTQGVVRSAAASHVFVASFVNARATAEALKTIGITDPSFVITGGDEDAACADYIESILNGSEPEFSGFEYRIRNSPHGRRFVDPGHVAFPAEDIDACIAVNDFSFAMPVSRRDGLCIARPDRPPPY